MPSEERGIVPTVSILKKNGNQMARVGIMVKSRIMGTIFNLVHILHMLACAPAGVLDLVKLWPN